MFIRSIAACGAVRDKCLKSCQLPLQQILFSNQAGLLQWNRTNHRAFSGGFQKQGIYMDANGEESLEYKKAKMGIVFTCSTCETRVTRVFGKRSYEKGVVIVRVDQKDGCKRTDGGTHCLHLIADNLGWFEDNPVNVEIMAARRGERVERVRVTDSTPHAKAAEGAKLLEQVKRAEENRTVIKEDDGQVVQMYLDDASPAEQRGEGQGAGVGEHLEMLQQPPPLLK